MEYKITLNWTNKQFRKLSILLGYIALIGFFIWYLIDLPMRYAPAELLIPYYFDFLPRWILYTFEGITVIGILAYLTFDIRRNANGVLRIDTDSVSITTKRKYDLVIFDQLKKITFIVHPMAFKPYRMEFIYYNDKFKRIIVRNEDEFHQIIRKITEVKPDDLEVDFGLFESLSK